MAYRNAQKTRLDLILAAESLVALHGLGGVSARAVAKLGGLKNNVSVQYHFNSLEQLFDEVVKFRMSQMEAIRAARAAPLVVDRHKTADLEQLFALVCLPHLEIREDSGQYPYANFLCHYLPARRPEGFDWVMNSSESITPVMQEIISQIRGHLPHLPVAIFNRRMTNATLVFLNVLRGVYQDDRNNSNVARHPLIEDAMRQGVALLRAPWIECTTST